MAGYETTSTLQNFLLYEIARKKDLQEKLRNEVKNLDLTSIDNIDQKHMPWLCATVSEALRLYSPVGIHMS
jgi:cytochrome P450 family 6